MDNLSAESRHVNMSHIRSRDTMPEKSIRRALFKAGFRYRICDRRYPGKPDLVFPHYYAVIFINGCFWHAHGWEPNRSSIIPPQADDAKDLNAAYSGEGCRYFKFPKSNQEFWKKKFMRNRERDAENLKYYADQCWRVCVVWECAIRGKKSRRKIEKVTEQIIRWLEEPVEEPEEAFLEIKG